MSVHKQPVPGGRSALTEYQTLAQNETLSLLECRLHTGRTHQIRAQLAAAGHPLLGDGKYGRERINRQYGLHHQALCSYRLRFSFQTDAGALSYLNGRVFGLEQVDFVETFFPQVKLGADLR